MKIAAHSLAGVTTNEDATTWLLANDEAMLCVVDGASGLGGLQASGWSTDAEWFAQSLAAGMVQAARVTLSPETLLAEALRLTRETPEADKVLRSGAAVPTAGVAIVTVSQKRVHTATLGDPTIAVLGLDLNEDVIHDPALTRLDDAITQALLETARRRGIHPEEVKPEFRQRFRTNRALANTPGGYWVADLTGKGLGHMLCRTYRRSDVQAVAMATDGFAMVVGANGGYADWRSVYNECHERGLPTLLEDVRSLILKDETWTRFPRFSKCDDMTLAVLDLA